MCDRAFQLLECSCLLEHERQRRRLEWLKCRRRRKDVSSDKGDGRGVAITIQLETPGDELLDKVDTDDVGSRIAIVS